MIKYLHTIVACFLLLISSRCAALSSGDISTRMISGFMWMDNTCTAGGPLGKVVAFRIKNTKGSSISNLTVTLGTPVFTATGAVSYTSGAPAYTCRTSSQVYIGNLAAGDSATAFFYIGYNCLLYPNNSKLTTDYITLPLSISDSQSGSVSSSFRAYNYVLKNSNNNTISVIASSTDLVGGVVTISTVYNISNVKPTNIIDMQLSAFNSFPQGYSIMGCKITASNITSDFAVNEKNSFYKGSIVSNLSSGGSVTIEWYLKIENALVGLSAASINPYIVSDAGSDQRWQANTSIFTATAIPVNPIVISKKVNYRSVRVNDSVVYTITIRNTSLLYDVTLDRLVDVMPRDYVFLHMENNTAVFPRLITYSNCTSYPAYLATGTLTFYGHMQQSAGVYSWIIPKNDSVKLIYSARVSSNLGVNDTNKITAYIGNASVGNSFALTNVLAPLPLKLLSFTAEPSGRAVKLSWQMQNEDNCLNYILKRECQKDAEPVVIGTLEAEHTNGPVSYLWYDEGVALGNNTLLYTLISQDYDGSEHSWYTMIRTVAGEKQYEIFQSQDNYIHVISGSPLKTADISLSDLSGRLLYSGTCTESGGRFTLPCDVSSLSGTVVIVTVDQGGQHDAVKILIN